MGIKAHVWGPMTHCVRWCSLTDPPGEREIGGLTPSRNMQLLPTYEKNN